MSNPVVFMDITIGGAAAGRLTFEVRAAETPARVGLSLLGLHVCP